MSEPGVMRSASDHGANERREFCFPWRWAIRGGCYATATGDGIGQVLIQVWVSIRIPTLNEL